MSDGSDEKKAPIGNPFAGRWQKGQSGNPSGKPRVGRTPNVTTIAKRCTRECIEKLMDVVRCSEKGSEITAAAKEVLYWAWEFQEKHPTSKQTAADEEPPAQGNDLSAVSNDDLIKLIADGDRKV